METLPNIDINIKCGNSLIHKIHFQVGQNIGTKDAGFSKTDQALIKNYKDTVKSIIQHQINVKNMNLKILF